MWQKEMVEVGCWYVLTAEEFEEVVRNEGMLKRMYCMASPSL